MRARLEVAATPLERPVQAARQIAGLIDIGGDPADHLVPQISDGILAALLGEEFLLGIMAGAQLLLLVDGKRLDGSA